LESINAQNETLSNSISDNMGIKLSEIMGNKDALSNKNMKVIMESKETRISGRCFKSIIIDLGLSSKNWPTLFCTRRKDVNTDPPMNNKGICVVEERSIVGTIK
tara:strand:- start:260 stop:571 length:312 start_codon:yes stop_codon:yes gene_type:complete